MRHKLRRLTSPPQTCTTSCARNNLPQYMRHISSMDLFSMNSTKNFLVAMCIKAETVVGLVSQLKPLVTFCAKIVILNLLACHISSDIYSIMVPSLVWTHKLSAHETARAWTICCKSGLNSTCLRDGRRRPLSFSAYAPPANFRM